MTREERISLASLAIAAFAVLLSQLRPLYTYAERPDVAISVNEEMQLESYFGFPALMIPMDIVNRGSASTDISRIDAFVASTSGDGYYRVMEMHGFFSPENSGMGKVQPYKKIPLAPGESSSRIIHFRGRLSDQDREEAKNFENKILLQLSRDLAGQAWGPGPPVPRLEPALVDVVGVFVSSNASILTPGEHYLFLAVYIEDRSEPVLVDLYSFQLYESDISYFREYSHRHIEKLMLPQFIPQPLPGVRIRLAQLNDVKLLNLYRGKYRTAREKSL